ncbi:MAG TPA: hypothetical protein VKM72_22025 [Thermoanaerobaculia bacterium]|nr:hypothetical protein [Thermoanaerobaculia bacterium]
MSTAYTWELGIDWNAISTGTTSYLRQGFVKMVNNQPTAMAPLCTEVGDTITFKIFDVSTIHVDGVSYNIRSFTILPKSATVIAPPQGDPFNSLQITFDSQTQIVESIAFATPGISQYPAWVQQPDEHHEHPFVTVQTPGRFLVSFLVQAGPVGFACRTFVVDPEMVVGSNGT